MFKQKSANLHGVKTRRGNGNGNHDMIHLQLGNGSSSNNGSTTEPLTPPSTPLQAHQHQHSLASAYKICSTQSSSVGNVHHNNQFAAISSNAPHNLLPSNSSPDPQLISQSILPTACPSARMRQYQESSTASAYYNCNVTGNATTGSFPPSYWDTKANPLSVIPSLSSSISDMQRGFTPAMSSPNNDNQLVQIGSPQCKETPSPPHLSPTSIVGDVSFSEKSHNEPISANSHLVSEGNSFEETAINQDTYPLSYPPNSHYIHHPHYQYFNSYYNQGGGTNGCYPHSNYTQHHFNNLHHSSESSNPTQLHYLPRKMNSNSTSPGSSISTGPSLSPSTGTSPVASKNKSSESCNNNINSPSLSTLRGPASTSSRLSGHKGNEEPTWA